jgi:hypothetical protein
VFSKDFLHHIGAGIQKDFSKKKLLFPTRKQRKKKLKIENKKTSFSRFFD